MSALKILARYSQSVKKKLKRPTSKTNTYRFLPPNITTLINQSVAKVQMYFKDFETICQDLSTLRVHLLRERQRQEERLRQKKEEKHLQRFRAQEVLDQYDLATRM